MATAIENPVDVQAAQSPADTERRFTVTEYYRMAEAGILLPEEHVELIAGRILKMSPKGIKHSASTTVAHECFRKHLGDRAVMRIEQPIHVDEFTEPEPDLVLAAPDPKQYFDHHPTPQEVLLVLELAGTSIRYDRGLKLALYARAGIPQYLILNLNADEVEEYRDPDENGYRSKQTYRTGQSFTLVAFPDVSIAVAELLPPA